MFFCFIFEFFCVFWGFGVFFGFFGGLAGSPVQPPNFQTRSVRPTSVRGWGARAADADGRPPSRVPAIWNGPVMTGTGLVQCNVKTPEAEKGRRSWNDSCVPSMVEIGQPSPASLLSTALVDQQETEPKSIDYPSQGPGGQNDSVLSSIRSAQKSDGGQSPAVTRPIETGLVRSTQTSSIVRKAPGKSMVVAVAPRRRQLHQHQQPEQDSLLDYVNGGDESMPIKINTKALQTRVKIMNDGIKKVYVSLRIYTPPEKFHLIPTRPALIFLFCM